MKKLWNTLHGQITIITLCIIAALFVIVGVLQYTFMKSFLYENKAESLYSQMRAWPPDPFLLKEAPEPNLPNGSEFSKGNESNESNGSTRNNEHLPQSKFFFQPEMIVSLVNENGTVTMISDHEENRLPLINSNEYKGIFEQYKAQTNVKYERYQDQYGTEYMVIFRQLGRNYSPYWLQVSYDLTTLNNQLYTQLAFFVGVAILAIVAGLLLLLFSLRKSLKPIHQMLTTVERTNAENLTEHLPAMTLLELDQLAQAFNKMLTRLDHSFEIERQTNERMRQFLADASHELRTPITSIHGFIEVLQRGAMHQPDQLKLALQAMENESIRMKSLVENLLHLAKLDQYSFSQSTTDFIAINLSQLLLDLSAQLQLIATNRKLTIQDNDQFKSYILGDRHQLTQVIINLVQNAVQHTSQYEGKITITLHKEEDNVQLIVSDNGEGISLEHQPHIFERFYRANKSRSRASGGAGLGLAITKAIIEAHNGSITLNSEPSKGSSFIIHLPINYRESHEG